MTLVTPTFIDMWSLSLLRLSRSCRTRRLVESLPITRSVVNRFVAGDDAAAAVRAASSLTASNHAVTIDVLGEDVYDEAGARRTRDAYLTLLDALVESGAAGGTDLSLKLSAVGQAIAEDGESIALEHAQHICRAAGRHGFTVTLDMEDHSKVDSTLEVGARLRTEFPAVGIVLQSNLRRTAGDIEQLRESGARVRIVKGAYRAPTSIAFQRKAEVDVAFARDIGGLMRSTCYPMVATHDPAMLAHAAAEASRAGRGDNDWEIQMLYGVRTDLQKDATRAGRTMRVYVPIGTDWYSYFLRRLAERPANVAFLLRALASGKRDE